MSTSAYSRGRQMDCEWVLERLLEHFHGELAVDERAAVEAHLVGCAACLGESDSLARDLDLLRSLEDSREPSPELTERIRARLEAGETGDSLDRVPREAPARWRRALRRGGFGASAALAAAAALFLALRPEAPIRAPQSTPSSARVASSGGASVATPSDSTRPGTGRGTVPGTGPGTAPEKASAAAEPTESETDSTSDVRVVWLGDESWMLTDDESSTVSDRLDDALDAEWLDSGDDDASTSVEDDVAALDWSSDGGLGSDSEAAGDTASALEEAYGTPDAAFVDRWQRTQRDGDSPRASAVGHPFA